MKRGWRRARSRQDGLEEIEYEPTSVKELLTEMKNVSELIVDLAYSAVVFDNEQIAAEVRYLEARMDTLNYRIRLTAMMAARTVEDAEQLAGILQVAQAAENISNAAGDIATLLEEVDTRPFLPNLLQQAEERIKQVQVAEGAPMDGAAIGALRVEAETGMRIIAVRRGRKWIYGPGADTGLRAGDSLVLRGTDEGFEAVKYLAQGEEVGA